MYTRISCERLVKLLLPDVRLSLVVREYQLKNHWSNLIKFGIWELKKKWSRNVIIYIVQINVAAILDEGRRVILRSSKV
jgi:hypothetical protein